MLTMLLRTLALATMLVGLAPCAYALNNSFPASGDTLMCSGRPWIDVVCNGADPTGAADSAAAINTTLSSAITNGWPVHFPAGTYKVLSKLTWDYANLVTNGLQVVSDGATIDGTGIASGNVLQILCSSGTSGSPVTCNGMHIRGELTVKGNTPSYVMVIGKTDFSDIHNGTKIDHLVVTNANANVSAGGIQVNYMTNGNLWLSGVTAGGSSAVGGVALEQVRTSSIGGFGSNAGASGPGLLIENGASVGNAFVGFGYGTTTSVCVAITSITAINNSWLVPYFPCTTAVVANTSANQNLFVGPTYAGTNAGPLASGVATIGRGSLSKFSAPSTASYTAIGTDDGTIFSAANGTGGATQFTTNSLPITLPTPSQVGNGWSAGFVSDANKAVIVNVPGGVKILGNGQQLTSLLVAGAGGSSNFETAILQSDGTNYRVIHMSQRASALNQLSTQLPSNWIFLAGPGYSVTSQDNGNVLSSGVTSSGLAVLLPQTTTLVNGWSVSFMQDASKKITINVNGTNGGQIVRSPGATVTSLVTSADRQILTLQYDGAGSFREISSPTRNNYDVRQWGAKCDWLTNATDDTAAIQAALNSIGTTSGQAGAIAEIPATGQGCYVPGGITVPSNVWLRGSTGPHWQGPLGNDPTQWLNFGSWLVCNNPTNPCVTTGGIGSAITDLGFWYTQPTPAALPATSPSWTPTQYPYTIDIIPPAQFNRLENLHIVAATKCIRITGPNSGVGGIFTTINNIHFDGCFDIGMQFNKVDNTLSMHNHRYDMYWNIGSLPMLDYAESHKVDWDMHYLANMQASDIEFFESWRAMQLTNGTVTSGFGNLSASALALQLINISANEVCQLIVPTDVSARGDGNITNLILARDTTTPTHCAAGTDVMMDLTSNFALWNMTNIRAADLQTVASLGPSSTLHMQNIYIPAYSFFSAGANAFKVSSGAELLLGTVSTRDIQPASGAGPVVGCGSDSTCGWSQPETFGFSGEGSIIIAGSANTTNTGAINFMMPDGTTRNCFLGRGTSAGDISLVCTGPINLSAGTTSMQLLTSSGSARMVVTPRLPASCSGLSSNDIWVDVSAGNALKFCP